MDKMPQGNFSFAGLAEVVKEFREVLKDLWYRNNQEKTLGELEIADKWMALDCKAQLCRLEKVDSIQPLILKRCSTDEGL
ncbi:MAG: hypothetical protein WC028_02850 [Candidatus Obscuribacterales bacterium]